MLTAIVLAAGLSTRMGINNKLLLYYRNKTVIANIVESILDAGIKDIIVVTGHEADLVKYVLATFPVKFEHNPRYAEGMTTSIQQGINAARGNGYMICLSDMLTITATEYTFLRDAFEETLSIDSKCICLPRYRNEIGNPVIFSAFYREAILQNQQPEGCKNIVQSNKEHLFYLEMDTSHILNDFDYPEEYQKLEP
ncbi:MAG: nucleotidyltransferase family protein [Chitinophagaceae bacterium]